MYITNSIEEVTDLCEIRVVTFYNNVYEVDRIIKDELKVDIENEKVKIQDSISEKSKHNNIEMSDILVDSFINSDRYKKIFKRILNEIGNRNKTDSVIFSIKTLESDRTPKSSDYRIRKRLDKFSSV